MEFGQQEVAVESVNAVNVSENDLNVAGAQHLIGIVDQNQRLVKVLVKEKKTKEKLKQFFLKLII